MKHSFFSSLKNTDLIRFDNNQILEIKKLKNALKNIFENNLESPLVSALSLLGIKTYKGTRIILPSGTVKNVYNSWFKEGVHCEILNLGEEKWKRGKIKIEISIEFEEGDIIENNDNRSFSSNKVTQSLNNNEDPFSLDDELELLKKSMQRKEIKKSVETTDFLDLELEDLRKKINDL